MTPAKRPAPNLEWVQMYRQGIPARSIAASAGVAGSVVRYHLTIAVRQDLGLRIAHQAAASPPPQRVTAAGQRNLRDVLAFHEAEGRLPVAGRDAQESKLAVWLTRRRSEATAGTLSPAFAALDLIPGWREQPTKNDADAYRWDQRLHEVFAWLAAGKDWPRHQKTEDREERTLGVWLHTQRINHRRGRLDPPKEEELDKCIPGWRHGRVRRGSKPGRQARS